MKSMTETFDASEFRAEAKPHFDALYELAKKHGVSMMACACTANDAASGQIMMNGTVHFNGPDRTPEAMVVAQRFCNDGLREGMKFASMAMMSQLIDSIGDGGEAEAEEAGDIGEPASATAH